MGMWSIITKHVQIVCEFKLVNKQSFRQLTFTNSEGFYVK